ncbi:hypothetical protein [Achromobacter sp. 413638]|uniref:hypothetical protein n=1 Tax=Achromobacter sp. 413638 TaxID=3342385 RepID=UPI00370C1C6F
MAEKIINGFSVVAYATQPEGRVPARAFLETRRLPVKPSKDAVKPSKDAAKAQAEKAAQQEGEEPQDQAPEQEEPQPFEIFISRRFRSTVEAMSAARNALDRVKSVDAEGVPDHLPE